MQQLSLIDIIQRGLRDYEQAAGATAYRMPAPRPRGAGKPAGGPRTGEPSRAPVSTAGLRRSAERIQERIDFCRRPRRENTRKRRQEAEGFEREAHHLERLQSTLVAVGDGHDDGTLPEILRGITGKLQVEALIKHGRMPEPGGYCADEYQALTRAGITADNFEAARGQIARLGNKVLTREENRARQIRAWERSVAGAGIPGFFPTPPQIVKHMLELADVRAGQKILEPSAGTGRIADQLAPLGVHLDTVEINRRLAELLALKGHSVVCNDFLEECKGFQYDRILMNPPFERGQDIDHVRHAFDCLRPGGRMVTIISEGAFCRSDKKAAEFRRWLAGLDHREERLAAGTFRESGTGVACRVLTIGKEARASND